MSISLKKILLTGTALVAVTFVSVPAQAAALAALGAPGTWASSGTPGSNDVTDAAAADTLDGAGFLLTITNNGTANDGSGLNTFAPGALTGSTGGVTITSGSANNLVVNGDSGVYSGAAPITITNRDVDNAAVTVGLSGALSNTGAGTLSVTNTETSSAKVVALTVGGNTSIGGITTITAGAFAGAATNVVNTGTGTYTGAATLTAGAGAGSDATITLNGTGTSAFTGGLTMDDGTAGLAKLTVSGTGVQVVNGAISAAAAGEGTLISNNGSNKVTFGGNIGGGSAATALKAITLTGIGDGTDGTTFSGTVRATDLNINNATGRDIFTGAVTATNITIGAANTTSTGITFNGGVTTTGGLTFGTNDALVTLGTGSNFTGTIDAGVDNVGTLTLAGASTVSTTVGSAHKLKEIKAGAGAAVFTTGAVKATTITVNGTSTVDFNGTGDVTATTLAFGANDGTVTLASGRNLDAAVTSNAGVGTLVLAGGTQTVSGAIDAANSIKELKAGATSANTTLSGTVAANTITILGNGTVNFSNNVTSSTGLLFTTTNDGTVKLAAGKTFTGSINSTGGTVGAGRGNMEFLGSTPSSITTIGNSGILKSLTLTGTGTTVTATGNIAAADTNSLNANSLVTSGGTFTLGAGQQINTTIADAATVGSVTSSGNATISTTALLNITVDTSTYIPTNTNFTIVNGNNGGAAVGTLAAGKLTVNGINSGAGQTVTEGLMTYAQAANTADLIITATRATMASVGNTANNDSVGAALDTIQGGGTSVVDAVQGKLQNASTAAQVNNILASVSPTVDGGAQTTALSVGAQVQGITETRIAAVRSGDGETGMAAGTSTNGVSMWVQGYGQAAQQDARSGVSGYDADTLGVAVGVDTTNLSSNSVLGIAFNYGRTSADSENVNTTSTDVDNYGVNLYGSYDFGQQRFLNAQLGYAFNNIDSDRHNVGFAGVTASGETESNQYTAKATLGSDYVADYGTILTPTLSAAYTHLATDGYTETGSGANLTVSDSNIDVLNVGVGLTAAWKLKNSDGSILKPALSAGYSYDVIGDRVEVTSSFVGAPGTAFASNGADPARNIFDAGAGFTYMTTSNWDMSANYDYTYKADYSAHSGVLRATSHF